MSGNLLQAQTADVETLGQTGDSRRRRRERHGTPSLEKGIKGVFTGIGFLVVTIVLAFTPMGRHWWFWMFIPAFATLGGGVAEIVRARYGQSFPSSDSAPSVAAVPPAPRASELPPRRSTSELMPPPPSVTEGTTRHLGSEGPTEYLATPRAKSKKNV